MLEPYRVPASRTINRARGQKGVFGSDHSKVILFSLPGFERRISPQRAGGAALERQLQLKPPPAWQDLHLLTQLPKTPEDHPVLSLHPSIYMTQLTAGAGPWQRRVRKHLSARRTRNHLKPQFRGAGPQIIHPLIVLAIAQAAEGLAPRPRAKFYVCRAGRDLVPRATAAAVLYRYSTFFS